MTTSDAPLDATRIGLIDALRDIEPGGRTKLASLAPLADEILGVLPVLPGVTAESPEQEPSIELRTEQAYMSGVRFERARITDLAAEHRARCDCQCGMLTVASPKPGHVRAFADMIREGW